METPTSCQFFPCSYSCVKRKLFQPEYRVVIGFVPWLCRTGWLEDEPCKPTGRLEYRPAAELGPVIVCLDTSGSMSGARETVAKVSAN